MNHVTQVKQALADLLRATLPGLLAAADVDAADGVETPPPAVVHRTDKTDLEDYPAIEMLVIDSQPSPGTTAQIYRHRLAVGYTVAGDDEQTLTTWGERYMWAIRQICRDTLLVPPIGTGPIDTGRELYTPVAQIPKGLEFPFVKGGFLEVFITTVE